MITFLAHFLFVLAAWTLVIKFLFPLAIAWSEDVALHRYIYWDFWWVIHLWLGWSLLHWRRYTFWLAIGTSLAEVAIVLIKLTVFLRAPQWTIWQTNWFINKLFVLGCFVLMLVYFVRHAGTLRRRHEE